MVMNYADTTTLAATAPTGLLDDLEDTEVERLLTHAAALIRRHTRAAVYPVDDAGNPTKDEHIAAFADATCAQVVAWLEAGVGGDIFTAGATAKATVSSSSINGASITIDNSQAAAARAHLTGGGLCPSAEMILADAGLLGGMPSIWF